MPLSMVTNYQDITSTEIEVLQRQFMNSHFYKHQQNTQPKKLAIFDFDSTLFFSPLLSPTLWHPKLISLATTESVYGPGWWRDIRSLDLGSFEELKKTAWNGFWNEKTVKEARECISDPDTMTVVLTGRRFHPFHLLIPDMLESKNLQFDLIGLRPDPEHTTDNHWEVRSGYQKLTYNLARSVFKSTMHFKTCFILNILHNVPSLKNVVMWDDRIPHVYRFREYLSQLHQSRVIDTSSVIYVPGIRPKYNPDWEIRVMQHIIDTHNKAVMDHSVNGKKEGKFEQRLRWPNVEKEDPLELSPDVPLKLTQLPCATIVKLSERDSDHLYDKYKPIFKKQLDMFSSRDLGGEQPVYFGDSIYISSQKVIPSNSIYDGPIGTRVKVTIKAYSEATQLSCLLLLAQIDDNRSEYILPLWYKPSEYNEIFKLKNIKWTPLKDRLVLKGRVDYQYRLGVEDKMPVSKKRGRGMDQEPVRTETKKTKVARA